MNTGVKSQTPLPKPATAVEPILKLLSAALPVRNEAGKMAAKPVGLTLTRMNCVSSGPAEL